MSESGESFVFYKSFLDAIEILPEEEQLKAFKLIAHYGANGELPEGEKTLANAIFLMAKPNIDATKEKRTNGKKGGRPHKDSKESKVFENENHRYEEGKPMVIENENHRLSKDESNVDVNVDVDVNVNEDVNVDVNEDADVNVDVDVDKSKKTKIDRFKKPTLEEATEYAKEHGLSNVNIVKFMDYYESNGWKVGKNSMKDWKAALRNWNRNDFDRASPSASAGVTQKFAPEGRDLSFLEM